MNVVQAKHLIDVALEDALGRIKAAPEYTSRPNYEAVGTPAYVLYNVVNNFDVVLRRAFLTAKDEYTGSQIYDESIFSKALKRCYKKNVFNKWWKSRHRRFKLAFAKQLNKMNDVVDLTDDDPDEMRQNVISGIAETVETRTGRFAPVVIDLSGDDSDVDQKRRKQGSVDNSEASAESFSSLNYSMSDDDDRDGERVIIDPPGQKSIDQPRDEK